ncbi:hypothetical protein D3C74_186430 [compost metagenome]
MYEEIEQVDQVYQVIEQQPIIYDIKSEIVAAFNDFYQSHIEGNLQIFHSLTIGEIVISILLAAIILLFVFKWIWEVLRY